MTAADILDRLAQLPRTQRAAIFAGLVLAVPLLFWLLVFTPMSEELGTLKTQNVELTAERDKVKLRAQNRARFEAELEELTERLKQALRELPNDREIPDLLKRISNVGKKAGLEIRKFQPLPEVMAEYYAEVPVALEVVGSYHEVAMFFDRLSKLGRIVSVQDVEMKNPEDRSGKVYLEVTGNAVTYRFLTDEEIKKRANADAGARRGKKGRN